MPTRDWRTVGELLADSDALARETLLDVSAEAAPAMVRTFPQVVQSGARVWSVLPAASLATPRGPELMVRLQAVGRGIGRSVLVSRWPGPGPTDERLAQVAYNLSRAAALVERYGRDVRPTTPDARADIAAAQARIMHTLYVASHGTSVAAANYAKDLHDQLQTAARRKTPLPNRRDPRDRTAALAILNRLDVFEQLAGTFVAAHPVTPAAHGEVVLPSKVSRLDSALARWDIQAHRTLAANPGSTDLVRVARVHALLAAITAVVAEAAAEKGHADPEMVRRWSSTLDASQSAWTQAATRWSEFSTPATRPDPALVHAGSEVRAAVASTTTGTGWATPDQLASRLDLGQTLTMLRLSVVAAVDIAHLTREVAATGQGLSAPARIAVMRAQGDAEAAADLRGPSSEDTSRATADQVAGNQVIALPEPVRLGLVNLADGVIAAATRAVSTAPALTAGPNRNGSGAAVKNGRARTAPTSETLKPPSEGLRR